MSQDKRPAEYDQNRYYAAEMLALVLSLPPELVDGVNEARQRVGTEGWVDALLKVVSVRSLSRPLTSCRVVANGRAPPRN